MRAKVILIIVCAVVFFGMTTVRADDMSELKDQIRALQATINSQQMTIEALNSKVETIEVKQEAQGKEIKKVPELAQKVSQIKEGPLEKISEGLNIGGHLKFTILDRTQGKRNGNDQHNNLAGGMYGMDQFFLYISKELSDWLKVDVVPQWDISSSATPALGSDISRATSTSISTRFYNAFMTVQLPEEYQLRVGLFNPMFSEDYAKETWWHELYNLPKGLCTIQSWHDTGAELYKNFDFENWSLPAYFYVLSGYTDRNIDNNENKLLFLHLAPEFFQSKLRLLGSFGWGKWDNKDKHDIVRSGLGFDWKYKKFNLLGEWLYVERKNLLVPSTGLTPTADGINKGYWLRAMYNLNPKLRFLVQQSYSNLYQAGLTSTNGITTTQRNMLSDKYYVSTLGVDFNLLPSSTIIGQYDHGNAGRSDGSESLKYDRFTLGWRTTF